MNKTLLKAIEVYGKENQITKAMEELSELIQALAKYQTGDKDTDHIAEEIADCKLMIEQLIEIFQVQKNVQEWEGAKIERLCDRLEVILGNKNGKDYIGCIWK